MTRFWFFGLVSFALAALSPRVTMAQALDPAQQYEAESIKLGTRSYTFFNAHTGQVLGGSIQMTFTRGGSALDGADFYNAIGRRHLAAEFDARRKRKIALYASGMSIIPVAIAVGMGVMFTDPMYGSSEYDDRGYEIKPQSNKAQFYAGLAVTAGVGATGIALVIAGAVLRADPLTYAEKRRAAEKYNEDLRRSLGLAEAKSALQTMKVTPSYDGRQLIVQLSGKF